MSAPSAVGLLPFTSIVAETDGTGRLATAGKRDTRDGRWRVIPGVAQRRRSRARRRVAIEGHRLGCEHGEWRPTILVAARAHIVWHRPRALRGAAREDRPARVALRRRPHLRLTVRQMGRVAKRRIRHTRIPHALRMSRIGRLACLTTSCLMVAWIKGSEPLITEWPTTSPLEHAFLAGPESLCAGQRTAVTRPSTDNDAGNPSEFSSH